MTAGEAEQVEAPLVPPPLKRTFDQESVDRAVQENDLDQIGIRPPLGPYAKELWKRRSFIQVLAVSKAEAENQNTYLGQVWALFSPIINASVYVLIFGFLLKVGREDRVHHRVHRGGRVHVPLLRALGDGRRALAEQEHEPVRSVHFPCRAADRRRARRAHRARPRDPGDVRDLVPLRLPPIAGKVTIDWYWLLLPVAVFLLWMFSTGCAFMVARWVAMTPDLDNLLPHFMRILMYASGVIFSVDRYLGQFSWGWVMEYQPVAVYLYLIRSCLLDEPAYQPDGFMWLLGVVWAVLFSVVGFLIFWGGEERYDVTDTDEVDRGRRTNSTPRRWSRSPPISSLCW